MIAEYFITGVISFVSSFVAGLLGLGGAVLLIPAYLYLPPLLGLHPFDVREISGMTSVQVLAGSIIGVAFHTQKGAVDARLVWTMGIPITLFALVGALLSKSIEPNIIIAVFASMAVVGATLVFLKRERENGDTDSPVQYSMPGAVIIAALVGFFGGMVGAPGAFILSPLMMTVLHIPTRLTIGSSLGIVLLSALAASTGKLITGQVPFAHTAIAVLAAIPGSLLGSRSSHKLHTKTLRSALAILIGIVGLQMWIRLLVD